MANRFTRAVSGIATLFLLVAMSVIAKDGHIVPLKNWPVPFYWQPTRAESQTGSSQPGSLKADASSPLVSSANASAASPPGSLVFVGMTPCRIADTRTGSGFTGAFGPPSLRLLRNPRHILDQSRPT